MLEWSKIKDYFLVVVFAFIAGVGATYSVMNYLHNKNEEILIRKYETEKADIKTTCNAEIKKLEIKNQELKSKQAKSKPEKPSTVTTTTQGDQSHAVSAGDNAEININAP